MASDYDFQRARAIGEFKTEGTLEERLAAAQQEIIRLRRELATSQSKLADNFARAWFDAKANKKKFRRVRRPPDGADKA